jgi:hypothetical protein
MPVICQGTYSICRSRDEFYVGLLANVQRRRSRGAAQPLISWWTTHTQTGILRRWARGRATPSRLAGGSTDPLFERPSVLSHRYVGLGDASWACRAVMLRLDIVITLFTVISNALSLGCWTYVAEGFVTVLWGQGPCAGKGLDAFPREQSGEKDHPNCGLADSKSRC